MNILKDTHRNKLNYIKQFEKTVRDSLRKLKERKDKESRK